MKKLENDKSSTPSPDRNDIMEMIVEAWDKVQVKECEMERNKWWHGMHGIR